MATQYTYEDVSNGGFTNGIQYLSATTTNRILFNNKIGSTTSVYTTAAYYPTLGGHEGSGTGRVVFDNAYSGSSVHIVDNDDRYTWGTALLSAANSSVATTYFAIKGITVTSATSGAGYTSRPSVVVTNKYGGEVVPLSATANMHSTGAGVTSVTVATTGVYVYGAPSSVPTVSFVGGGYTVQATGTVVTATSASTGLPVLSLSATDFGGAWGPTERRLRLLGYF
jgi:hypothetical protein